MIDHSRPRRKSPTVILALCIVGLFITVLIWSGASPTSAASAARLGLELSASLVPVGEQITVTVRVSDIQELYGADVHLSYDPTVLQALDADAGRAGVQVRLGNAPSPDFVLRREADNAAGTAWYAVTSMRPQEPFAGEGVVFTAVFGAVAPGASPLRITYNKLVDRTGVTCAYSVDADTQVDVSLGMQPVPTPPLTPLTRRLCVPLILRRAAPQPARAR